MRVVHFSDWHSHTQSLPPADVYVCTGDMLPNWPFILFRGLDGRLKEWMANAQLLGREPGLVPSGSPVGRRVDPALEEALQREWVEARVRDTGGWRRLFGSSDAPVVCVRGNHDFVDLAPMFLGGPVHEVGTDSTQSFELLGLRWGGTRGINRIAGEWSDELYPAEFDGLARLLPDDLDALVTHSPPLGVLDEHGHSLGSQAIRSYVERRAYARNPLKMHLFGHIHEACGQAEYLGTKFSNAATTVSVVDL